MKYEKFKYSIKKLLFENSKLTRCNLLHITYYVVLTVCVTYYVILLRVSFGKKMLRKIEVAFNRKKSG